MQNIKLNHLAKMVMSVVGCQMVGIIGTIFTADAIPNWYNTLTKPFFAPPNWLFGPVWTVLYLMMGVSFYLLWKQGWKKPQARRARNWFLAQLAFNFIWTPVFFGLRSPLLGLVIIAALVWLIVLTIKNFYPLSKWASYLLVSYLLWVSFATLLNGAIVFLN